MIPLSILSVAAPGPLVVMIVWLICVRFTGWFKCV
jgi:hypothetical protein